MSDVPEPGDGPERYIIHAIGISGVTGVLYMIYLMFFGDPQESIRIGLQMLELYIPIGGMAILLFVLVILLRMPSRSRNGH